MLGNCETCGEPAVGYGPRLPELPNHPEACREHCDPTIVFQRSYGYVQRDEAETHIRETIAEAMDALAELIESNGLRRDSYDTARTTLAEALDLMRFVETEAI